MAYRASIPYLLRLAGRIAVLFVGALALLAGSPAFASPSFLISPDAFDFGDVGSGAIAPGQTVTITNVSGAPQTLSLTGGGAGVFGGVQNCQGLNLAPGASC
jgi:hypothetical protein